MRESVTLQFRDMRRFGLNGEGCSRARVLIAGRVQGVGFRYETMVQAEARGVRGWVRNLVDGRVEVVAQGATSAVQDLVGWCRAGPRHASVHDVNVAWEPPGDEPPGFRVQ